MLTYATQTDLTAGDTPWLTTAPANAGQLLRSASLKVTDATKTAVYTVDSDGYPTDTATRQAFRDAVCAQVAMWASLDADPNLGALDTKAAVRAKGIGSGRIDYDTNFNSSVTAFQARQDAIGALCPDALAILNAAGLLNGPIVSYG